MSDTKLMFKNSFLYTISGILSKCINFFMLPIFTLYLTPSGYGEINMIMSFNAVLNYLVILSLDSAIMRLYAEYKDNQYILKRLYGSILVLVSINTCIILGICIIFKNMIITSLLGGISFIPHFLIGLMILSLSSLYTLHRRYLEATQNGNKLTLISITGIILTTIITVITLSIFKMGSVGVLISYLVVNIFYVIFMIFDIIRKKSIAICLDVKLLKEALKYALPIIPHNMSGYIATFFSKWILNISSGLGSVGLFTIAIQITSVIEIFQDSANHAYRPWLNDILKTEPEKSVKKIQLVSKGLLLFYTFIYIGIALFSFEIIMIMTSDGYISTWKLIPFLVMAYSLNAIYYFYIAQCFYYVDTNKRIFIVSIIGSIVNIVSSYFIVPIVGMYGVPIAIFLSICIRIVLLIYVLRDKEYIGYDFFNMVKIIFPAWIFIIIGVAPSYYYDMQIFSLKLFIYKITIYAIYILFIYLFYKKDINVIVKDKNILKIITNKLKRG